MLNRKVDIITTAAGDPLVPPSSEESQSINEQIAADPDDLELDGAWFKRAKPTSELFPEAYEVAVRRKEALQAGRLANVSITLDQSTIDWYKAQTGEDGETGGTAWVALIEEAVRFYALMTLSGSENAVDTGPRTRPYPHAVTNEEAIAWLSEMIRRVAPAEMSEHHEQRRTSDR